MDRDTHCPNCFKEPKPTPCCQHCGFDADGYIENANFLSLFTPLDRGKYLIGRVLGEGGFGVVYAGLARTLNRPVAIKEFFPASTNSLAQRKTTHHVTARKNCEVAFEDWKNNFLREATLLAQFNHPRVVQVYDVVLENNTVYLIMERLEGCLLSEYLGGLHDDSTRQTLSAVEGRCLLNAVLEALDVLHSHNPPVIHRDLTPYNLFLQQCEINQLKVLDFGLARLGERQQGDASIVINVGNPGFASPEQLGYYPAGITRATDFYTLGAALYTALTGKTPDTQQRCTASPPLPPPSLPQNFGDPALAHVISACLEISPKQRPQSVEDIRRRLSADTVVIPEPPHEPVPLPPTPLPPVIPSDAVTFPDVVISKKKLQHPWLTLIGLIFVVAMAAVAGTMWNEWKNLPSSILAWWQPARTPQQLPTAQTKPSPLSKVAPLRRTPTYQAFQIIQDRLRDGSSGPALVVIPAGSFQMGSPEDESGLESDELQHPVTIEKAFALGQHEVTVGEFKRFVTATQYPTDAEKNADSKEGCYIAYKEGDAWKYDYRAGYSWQDPNFRQEDDHPVVCVSWNDATAYIQWLSKETGQHYRLPTEAEWEYAARAGTTTARYWGDDPKQACQYANVADQAAKETFSNWLFHECTDNMVYTAPIGSYDPNGWKLYDMLGNVWEWTCSDYRDKYDNTNTELRCQEQALDRPVVLRFCQSCR